MTAAQREAQGLRAWRGGRVSRRRRPARLNGLHSPGLPGNFRTTGPRAPGPEGAGLRVCAIRSAERRTCVRTIVTDDLHVERRIEHGFVRRRPAACVDRDPSYGGAPGRHVPDPGAPSRRATFAGCREATLLGAPAPGRVRPLLATPGRPRVWPWTRTPGCSSPRRSGAGVRGPRAWRPPGSPSGR
jgi:hypothetical protein